MAKPLPVRSMFKETLLLFLGFVFGVLLTGGVAFFLYDQTGGKPQALRESDIPSASGYKFTDPILGVSVTQADSPAYADLEQNITKYLAAKNTGLTSASVNFRDILAGQGFTVNPAELYNPASLLKVPVMMAYYNLAQQDPSVLLQEMTYSGQPDLDIGEQVESPVQLTPGSTYTVEQLIEHMIRYSDNNAVQLLSDHLKAMGQYQVLTDLFANLGIDFGVVSSSVESLNVQSYSIFLRVLYNATYLDRDYSEKALSLMTQTDFADGLENGVPNGVEVAQKFGDGKIADQTGTQTGAELQNCGIIYYPDHPYLLCIMTKGDNVADLEKVIAGVSRLVYQDMESRYPAQ